MGELGKELKYIHHPIHFMHIIINKILNKINSNSLGRVTGFIIGNTASIFSPASFYPIPIRKTGQVIYGGVIVNDYGIAKKIAATVNGKVDYIFVDAESKIKKNVHNNNTTNNIELAIRKVVSKSKIVTFKGNDLAVEAVDLTLSQLINNMYGSNVAIIGCGNIGSKIALKLVERGANIKVYRRDKGNLKKIIDGLNSIKSDTSPTSIKIANNIAEACKNANVIIATANAKNIIGKNDLKFANKTKPLILLDVGKGCFSDDIVNNDGYTVYRTDISMVQKHNFSALLETRLHYDKSMGRKVVTDKKVGRITLVSLGLLGRFEEIIVDDINKPTQIIGVSDGKGSLIKNIEKYRKILEKVRTTFKLS